MYTKSSYLGNIHLWCIDVIKNEMNKEYSKTIDYKVGENIRIMIIIKYQNKMSVIYKSIMFTD